MDKFINENTLYGWPPKVSANHSNLSPEERQSILEQKERLEKEKQELISALKKVDYNFDDPPDMVDYTDKVVSEVHKLVQDKIDEFLEEYYRRVFVNEDGVLSEEEYDEFIKEMVKAHKAIHANDQIVAPEIVFEDNGPTIKIEINGGNKNGYIEIE